MVKNTVHCWCLTAFRSRFEFQTRGKFCGLERRNLECGTETALPTRTANKFVTLYWHLYYFSVIVKKLLAYVLVINAVADL